MHRINKIGLLLVAMLIVVGGAVYVTKGLGQKKVTTATVTVAYSGLPDTNGLSVKFNGQSYNTASANTYLLTPGPYTIDITKPGYQSFTTRMVAALGQTYTVNVQLQPSAPPPAISNINQINTGDLGIPQGATIVSTTYFYNNTWAVVVASAYGSNAAIVAKYDLTSQSWNVELGPGSSFSPADTRVLPDQVSGYLESNNFTE